MKRKEIRESGRREAMKAREDAEAQRDAIRGRWPFIRAWATDLRRIREANHFAESIREAFR